MRTFVLGWCLLCCLQIACARSKTFTIIHNPELDPYLSTSDQSRVHLRFLPTSSRRAEVIQKWAFDERTLLWVVGISTGAITIALSRVILLPFGI